MGNIRNTIEAVSTAIHADEAFRHLIASHEAPEQLLNLAADFMKSCNKRMNTALAEMPGKGPERLPQLGDYPGLEKRPYSTLHWCVLEYCVSWIGFDKEWKPGDDPVETRKKFVEGMRSFGLDADDSPVPQEDIDRYRVKVKFAEYLTAWKSEFLP